MNRKEIKLKRMLEYFIDATVQLIQEEGIENVSARKIADKTGYASSTIYNYFGELSHLLYFASMRYVKDYLLELSSYLEKGQTYVEKYLLSWECFCKHSFANPQIYHAVYIADLGEKPEDMLKRYFSIYSSELVGFTDEIRPLLFESDLTIRSKALLEMAKREQEINDEAIEEVNEMAVLIWEGMMTALINKRRNTDPQMAVEKTMKYIRKTMKALEKC